MTVICWILMLSFIFKTLTIHILVSTFIISMAIFILITIWSKYNHKRYAHLNRRTFPKDVVNDDIELYFGIGIDIIEKMQNNKVIILKKTIV